ncbi:TIGR03668 family PPOX class F420-dependent oxidoreductase [Dactylosporangium sucinum]|uniref:PPOX class F420-dependent oxidoreductase n=1 Tax=Dactylosporangium sucinum TaxID=1424081 RepID=A0A917WZH7_9ACTN|nr:TIGR03668 family PPOX class F420-dependent oxidoreductase [Dactylosporangium sucinum]GGM49731.1 PPOX class F420-dependent oxidoreductase [Dactylosporangium sucinum]
MTLSAEEARRRFTAARVARLATVSPAGRPHVVPIVFAVAGDVVYHGVDAKPKRHTTLRRVTNLAANPRAALLVDHYDDDWSRLWWVRADGVAREVDPAGEEGVAALARLADRYPAFRLTGTLLAIDVESWTGWSA